MAQPRLPGHFPVTELAAPLSELVPLSIEVVTGGTVLDLGICIEPKVVLLLPAIGLLPDVLDRVGVDMATHGDASVQEISIEELVLRTETVLGEADA